jgi:hypothetical protein
MTASVQMYFMLNSNRMKNDFNKNIFVWLKSFYTFFAFGDHGIVAILNQRKMDAPRMPVYFFSAQYVVLSMGLIHICRYDILRHAKRKFLSYK